VGCLGVHFALSDAEVHQLCALADDASRLEYLKEAIEENNFTDHEDLLAPSYKTWDAMHRALADGHLTWDGGEYPLNHVVLGGQLLYGKPDYIMSLKNTDEVLDIAAALPGITESEFRRRYFAINAAKYGFPLSEDDFGYTWEAFNDVRDLYAKAASLGRCVLFTASQ